MVEKVLDLAEDTCKELTWSREYMAQRRAIILYLRDVVAMQQAVPDNRHTCVVCGIAIRSRCQRCIDVLDGRKAVRK